MSKQKIINFMGQRHAATVFSLLLIIGSIVSLAVQGISFGLDFTGGTQVEVAYEKPADLDKVRSQMAGAGYQNVTVLHFGTDTDVMIRLQESGDSELGAKIGKVLSADGDAIQVRSVDQVGSQVGEELRDKGGIGMLAALLVVMVYVSVRFQFKFALGAVVALIHDVIITLGFFSVLRLNFDLTELAAVLAVIGYSLNDTIVVADRIRENFREIRRGDAFEIINTSVTQTLGRTVITSFTTLLVLFALFVVGGERVHNFSIALITGIAIGTYSSIYVAANVLMLMKVNKEDLMPQLPENEEADSLP